MMFISVCDNELIIDIYVQPGAKVSHIVGMHGDRLKVKINAPPVDGKANYEVVEFFSRVCATTKSNVKLLSGDKSRNKRIKILGNIELIQQQIQGMINE